MVMFPFLSISISCREPDISSRMNLCWRQSIQCFQLPKKLFINSWYEPSSSRSVWNGLSSSSVIVNIYLFCSSFVPIRRAMSSRPRSDHFDGLGLRLNHFLEFLKLVSSSICLQSRLIKFFKHSYCLFSLSSDINALSISFTSELLIALLVVFLEDILNGFGKLTSPSEISSFILPWLHYFSAWLNFYSKLCSALNSATNVLFLDPNFAIFYLESFIFLYQPLLF